MDDYFNQKPALLGELDTNSFYDEITDGPPPESSSFEETIDSPDEEPRDGEGIWQTALPVVPSLIVGIAVAALAALAWRSSRVRQ